MMRMTPPCKALEAASISPSIAESDRSGQKKQTGMALKYGQVVWRQAPRHNPVAPEGKGLLFFFGAF